MTNHKKRFYRDRSILEKIEDLQALDTEQIQKLFFNRQKCGKRIAQRRMFKLTENKRVKRVRLSIDTPYYYFIDKRPKQLEHIVSTNWVYVWLATSILKYGEEIVYYKRELDYKIIRADGFIAIKNTETDRYKFFFIETDLSNNSFDKIPKYNTLYETKGYLDKWWVSHTDRFPTTIIVTHRPILVRDKIKKENVNNLRFEVYTLDQIKGVVGI